MEEKPSADAAADGRGLAQACKNLVLADNKWRLGHQ
jgi:hypothetical protein